MGWKRINGRLYYYRSKREGGRVVSEYVGAGEAADLIARMDAVDRQRRETERRDERAERERDEAEDRALAEWFDEVEAAAREALAAAGYHRHKGQWRKRRSRERQAEGAPLGGGDRGHREAGGPGG